VNEKLLMKLRIIYGHFGIKTQDEKLWEEVNEWLESGELEEEADMLVLLMQKYLHNQKLRDLVDFKVDRTLFRITENYYEQELLV